MSGIGVPEEARGTVSSVKCHLVQDTVTWTEVHSSDLVHEIHPGEEHLDGPVELSRPGLSYRVVPSSPGVGCHL